MESFDIATSPFGTKDMTGLRFETGYDAVQGNLLNIISDPAQAPAQSPLTVWIAPSSGGGQLCIGGVSGSTDPQDAFSRFNTNANNSEFRHIGIQLSSDDGGDILFAAADARPATDGLGGGIIITGGNGEGLGNGGDCYISSGSAAGTGVPGDTTIEGQNTTISAGVANIPLTEWDGDLFFRSKIIDINITDELIINTDPGAEGQVLTSQGTGTPPVWADPAATVDVFYWRADTSSTSGTGIVSGRLRWNNATQGSSTHLFISTTSIRGIGLSGYLNSIVAGNRIVIQEENDPDNTQRWEVVSSVDNTTYFDFTVTLVEQIGGNIGNNQTLVVGFIKDVGGGSATVDYEAAVATASQTVFNTTLPTVANGSGLAYLQVFRNGIKQQEGAGKHYTVTGANQITFNTGLTLNDDVEFYAF